MKGLSALSGALGAALVASVAQAQVTTTCRPANMFIPSMGTTCDTTGALPAQSASTDDSGGAAALALGVLSLKQAVHERRTKDRAARVAALVTRHDCEGAVRLALAENDPAMAARVPGLCKTAIQAGLEPAYLSPGSSADQLQEWGKANLTARPGEVILSITPDRVDAVETASAAPPGALWVRQEALSAEGEKALKGRSQLLMVAFDCLHGQFRVMASTRYPGQNMTGDALSSDHAAEPMMVRPGSVAEAWSKRACPLSTPATTFPVGAQAVQATLPIKP